jgi:hypothetical protein
VLATKRFTSQLLTEPKVINHSNYGNNVSHFFLEHAGVLRIIIWRRIRSLGDSNNPLEGHDQYSRRKHQKKTKDRQNSHGHKLRSPLAPAIHHNLASSLISCMMELKLGWDPSKTTISMLPNPPCHQDDQIDGILTIDISDHHKVANLELNKLR